MTIRHQPDPARPHYEAEAIRRLTTIAHARHWTIDVEPTTRFAARLTLPDGRRHVLVGADLGLNTAAARRVAEDKAFAAHFLNLDNIPTVPASPITDPAHAARTIAEHRITYPCIIKPNRAHEARGLTVLQSESDLPAAIDLARTVDPVTLLQPFDPRPEHRLVLLDGQLIAAFRKHRPSPTAPANLAAGATWTDATADVHESNLALARRALAALSLTYAAIDLLAADLGEPAPSDAPAAVLEVNATPGFKALTQAPAALDRLFTAVADRIERTR